jgi:hypothetical protein
VEDSDPAKAKQLREQARRGRDVWFKGSFGMQDEEYLHTARAVGRENVWYPFLDTRTRKHRFSKWGMINDPDCSEGDASTNWYDRCPDPHSSGVLGYRKYLADPSLDEAGKVVFDPATSPYREDELKKNLRYVLGGPCVQCHVAFDPTNPPKDPNQPKWENVHATIGNQYTTQPLQYVMGVPEDHIANQVLKYGHRTGTIDTSVVATDFQHNPGTQNNIMDFFNKRVFEHEMKDPITGEVKKSVHLRYPNYSGTLATGGGVVFLALLDGTIAAYDDSTLDELWKINVGSGFNAPPMTFEANGKQYVAVLQGGGGGNSNQQKPTNHGDAVNAFALP